MVSKIHRQQNTPSYTHLDVCDGGPFVGNGNRSDIVVEVKEGVESNGGGGHAVGYRRRHGNDGSILRLPGKSGGFAFSRIA